MTKQKDNKVDNQNQYYHQNQKKFQIKIYENHKRKKKKNYLKEIKVKDEDFI